ncbi:MAG: hypothetical protein EAZ34_05675 [Polaromonas sp.]|nr:MAG: hypothetical protein EAZ34_05675 [Polaromonas sp.]
MKVVKSFNAEAQRTQSKTRGNKFLLLSLRFSAPEALKVSLFIDLCSLLLLSLRFSAPEALKVSLFIDLCSRKPSSQIGAYGNKHGG